MQTFEDRAFLFLVITVSLAFAWILIPFYSAILWGVVLAVMFTPLYRRLARSMRDRRTAAALVTITVIVLIVLVPLALITLSLFEQATAVYERVKSGELNFARYLQQVIGALPTWATDMLDRLGIASVGGIQERLSMGFMSISQFLATRALSVGQNTLNFVVTFLVMLYLLFFLLRDGDDLTRRIRTAIPLRPEQRQAMFSRFTLVIRAIVKGTIVVAILQGALGGLIFWILGVNAALFWGVLMAILSLLPAVGTALVWLPVAVYFLATGAMWKGIVLIAFGVLVIGLVDNVVRPILVGKDTKIPDYVVLITTLGGLALFGFNGFVIGPVIAAMFIAAWDIFPASISPANEKRSPIQQNPPAP